jgi:hypothetical protein
LRRGPIGAPQPRSGCNESDGGMNIARCLKHDKDQARRN